MPDRLGGSAQSLGARRLPYPNVGELGLRLGLRDVRACAERIVYWQLFVSGLTALDALDEATFGAKPGQSHRLAQQEMRDLIGLLTLPITASAHTPLDLDHELVDEGVVQA